MGVYFGGRRSYGLGRSRSGRWNNSYGLEEPDTPLEQSRTTFRTGLQTKFNLTSRIGSIVDLYYVHDDYHAVPSRPAGTVPFSDNTFDPGITRRHNLTPMFAIQAGSHYTEVNSDFAGREYSRKRVFGGANVTF